ncbi:2,3-diaminopropionate biosynthesis protein SbnA [Actinokineospora sp. PR83]|uniref:2,3-diaminopropionate biosynthesis protein SbnA n=1 Tax=Actinokineospora sp. PR83 TaxID=2884908 RepID=UPI0027E0E0BE|nr:2,3-diaminopropionate biosynthesis protein SbnA [Actinokineospora sp. PR83]MCG8914460.1 2,3-diaminopropionate biosynthesis protein SbnA [Actinokineospora sp. PR83]
MAVIVSSPCEFTLGDLYVDLTDLVPSALFLKCEGFNFAGSIKLKAAEAMVSDKERSGELRPGGALVESSSGNMGVALAVVAAARGYRFTCVTDDRSTRAARAQISALGAALHVVSDPGRHGSHLAARLALVRELCAADPDLVWLNQYTNPGNWGAHYHSTAEEIAKDFADLDVLFVGAGTTGTLMGCARWFRRNRPSVAVVAVDTAGSTTFGGPPGPRHVPGLGTSVRPAILDESYVDDVVLVAEVDGVRACRELARRGYLLGGSSGTVLHGARTWLEQAGAGAGTMAVAISPDLGHAYAETVYDDGWVAARLGRDAV